MEGVDHLVDEQRYGFKIIVPQHHQQNADAPRNIQVSDSLRHGFVSSTLILPRELECWHNLHLTSSSKPCLATEITPLSWGSARRENESFSKVSVSSVAKRLPYKSLF